VKCSIQYDDHIPEVSLEFTYGDLIHDVNCLAAGLQTSGLVKRGHCVAMALPNYIEFVVTLLAVNQVGAFISLINPVYTPRLY
jgi:acyl-CoA synthetase (AMP-forming)/AMP-acid ligase II